MLGKNKICVSARERKEREREREREKQKEYEKVQRIRLDCIIVQQIYILSLLKTFISIQEIHYKQQIYVYKQDCNVDSKKINSKILK